MLVLAAVALAARVGLVVLEPFKILRATDAADYQRLAVSLASGHGWGVSQVAPGGGPTAFRAPLYPLVLSGIYKVFGVHVTAARIGGAVLGSLAVLLLVSVTWMTFGRTVALVAGSIAAVFPPMIIASTGLMTEALAVPLELAALAAALRYRRGGPMRWVVLCGALLGLAVLTRPNLAVLVLPLGLFVLRKPTNARALLAPTLLVAAFALALAPWMVRDRLTFGRWVPLTTQSGVVVAGTYNHTSATFPGNPAAWIPFPWDKQDAALMARHPKADEIEESALLQSAAIRYATEHPSYVAEVAYENTRRMFDLVAFRWTQNDISTSYGLPPVWGDADALFAVPFLLLSLGGVFVAARRFPLPAAYWLAPVLLVATTVVLQGIPRFRAELDPFLVQLTAVASVAGWLELRRRRALAAPSVP
jgi:4-amino-4-deoxy-L-arabinose transferase-like glycosyltransferase